MLYGQYAQHPWREDMFLRPDIIQKNLKKWGFGFDIGVVTQPPGTMDEPPKVRIARNPIYDQHTGDLKEAHFLPGTITDYPGVIDHWVGNFQDEILQPDGSYQRTAHGIGLPAARVWNHKSIQYFGNHKDKMDAIIQGHGVGIPMYAATDYDMYASRHGATLPLVYKPQGGSLGLGVRVFASVQELKKALQDKMISPNGFLQEFIENNHPIRGIMPATKQDEELLKRYNVDSDRPREIRMHVITTTDNTGRLYTEAYPVMKVSYPHRQTLKYELGIGIDPTCLGPGSLMHDKSVELAQAVCQAAGTSDKPTPQYYGVFDWIVRGDVHDPDAIWVGDGNCRGPGLPVNAYAAREAFERALVSSARSVINSSV